MAKKWPKTKAELVLQKSKIFESYYTIIADSMTYHEIVP